MGQPSLRKHADLDLTSRLAEQVAVERVRQGDGLALEVIFIAHRGQLLSLARRITGSQVLAEDVVQDVFLAIWTGRDGWCVNTSLAAYLRRAVHNVASRTAASRSRGLSPGVELGAEAERAYQLSNAHPAPDVHAERESLRDAVNDATKAMSARSRDVFSLSHSRDFSNREIATALGISVKTVEVHMTRALGVLRRHLARWRP